MRDTKREIIKAGTRLFLKHSYQGTGINQILKECGIPKGSFYHFFPSKEAFALAVLESQVSRIEHFGRKYLQQASKPHVERFIEFYQHLMKPIEQSNYSIGCLVGTFGQEMAALSQPLCQALDRGLAVLKNLINEFIKDGQLQGQFSPLLNAGELASYIVAAMQGSIIMAKVEKNSKPIEIFIQSSARMLDGTIL